MPMRPIRLPGDLSPLTDMLAEAFQYPDHPEWGIRPDEQEDIVRTVKSLRKLWPIVRVLQLFSPSLRDLMRGFVWEEDGRMVGVVFVQRDGSTNLWEINIVGVLPEHRGKGIARKLLTRALEDLRKRGAKQAALAVIDRNIPAYSLYRSLGFEHYGGTIEFETSQRTALELLPLPSGYLQEPVKRSKDWRVRYELDKRINPPELKKYEPVLLRRYRPPRLLRPLGPVLEFLQRRERKAVRVFRESDRQTVAWARYDVPTRSGGVNSVRVALDPEHAELADYLVAYHLERAVTRGPGRRVGFMIPNWMHAVVMSAEKQGFTRRLEYHHLGLML